MINKKKIYTAITVAVLGGILVFNGVANREDASAKIIPQPVASGTTVYNNSKAAVDASNASEGYIMVKYTGGTDKKIKCIVQKSGGAAYTYNLNNKGNYETFPLAEGNGKYSVTVYENISGTKYSTAYNTSFNVNIKDEFSPFLYPNQYVNFNSNSDVVALADKLVSDTPEELDKLKKIYYYVIGNISYDTQKAQTVQSGYLPNPDEIIKLKKGICFDYAAVMTSMLRSQGIPSKLVVGYSGSLYHAWINVYIKGVGWIDKAVYFDGKSWELMDPTFASSSKNSIRIQQYIGDGSNYTAKYAY
ncbi:transglutaminase [Tyzzerella sp. An114]|uniref:transglutaminase-like domain-containing protein n=1 Tax=Tyzzerella sp. An114 TaxID=1965545 RepID=UPI000B449922|nr:transglutaminase-like domain-containing protein [Tyzzerella sp. An114]OUQ57427.1 transglutaminase [Tyzzerella sp. An114]